MSLRRPAFEGRNGEESHHACEDVVKVEITFLPHPLADLWLRDIAILVYDEGAPGIKGEHGMPRQGFHKR